VLSNSDEAWRGMKPGGMASAWAGATAQLLKVPMMAAVVMWLRMLIA
jgi:hypothetical protein